MRPLVGVSLCDLDVHGLEDRKDVCLNKGDDQLDDVDHQQDQDPRHAGQGAHGVHGREVLQHRLGKERCHDGKRAHDDVAGEHVAEQTDGERDQAQAQGRGS